MVVTLSEFYVFTSQFGQTTFSFLVFNSFYNNELKCHEIKLAECCQRLMRDREDIDNLNCL